MQVNRLSVKVVAAVVLAVTLPYWTALPLLVDFVPAQAVLGAMVYVLELVFMALLIMAVIEGRIRLMLVSVVIGFVFGAIPGPAPVPLAIFLPVWLKAVIPAMVLGLMINHGRRAWQSFFAAALLMAVFILMIYFQGGQQLAEQTGNLRESIEGVLIGPMTSSGYSAEAINNLVDQLFFFMQLVIRLLPGLLILSGAGQLFVALLCADWYYTRRDSYFPGFGPFTYWKMPEKLLYLLGMVLIIRLVFGGGIQVVTDNAVFILAIAYAVCGLALIEHLLRRLRLPVLIRVIFYVGLTFMHIPGLVVTSIAGLFDSYFDFRKVRAHTLG